MITMIKFVMTIAVAGHPADQFNQISNPMPQRPGRATAAALLCRRPRPMGAIAPTGLAQERGLHGCRGGHNCVKLKNPVSVLMLVTTTWTGGESNNTIYSLDGSGQEKDLFVNTIGGYKGSTLINKADGDSTAALKIEGEGS